MTDTDQLSSTEARSVTNIPTEELPDSQADSKSWKRSIIKVDSFVSEGTQYRIEPALVFHWDYDTELNAIEVVGTGVYENSLIFGDTLSEAQEILVNDYVPFLWEVFAFEDDSKLDLNSQAVKYDLLARVKNSAGANL